MTINMITEQLGTTEDATREVGERIFRNLCMRMAALRISPPAPKREVKKQPDVVVFVDDCAVLLEPQNWRSTQWLCNRCNLSIEDAQVRERIRVHPCQWEKVVTDLKDAGFNVLY